jgi:hypothetical protein
MKYILIALCLALAACDGDDKSPSPSPANNYITSWTIGPIIDGKNYSVGLPKHPSRETLGWSFEIGPDKEPHYITTPTTPLTNKKQITIHYEVQMAEGVRIYPKCCFTSPAMGPTLYFQVRNDDWNTDGNRWWATFATPMPIVAGEHTITVPLDGPWTSVKYLAAATSPDVFKAAKEKAGVVGFTLGGGDGYGHGVRATGPVKFIVKEFSVQ